MFTIPTETRTLIETEFKLLFSPHFGLLWLLCESDVCKRLLWISLELFFFLFFCAGNSPLVGEANQDWKEGHGVAANAKQNFRPQSAHNGSALSCKDAFYDNVHILHCDIHRENDEYLSEITFHQRPSCILWGVKAKKRFLCQYV